jgi:hypothetical protein
MTSRSFVGLLAGAACWLFASLSHAQCTKDTDCKGERVCEAGTCVSAPAPAASSAVPVPGAAPPPASPAPPRMLAAPVSTTTTGDEAGLSRYEVSEREERSRKRNWKRHSTGMMVGGIVMVSFVPVALVVSMVASLQKESCESGGTYNFETNTRSYGDCGRYDATIYGGVITGVALLGAGIPLIVIGAKRQPLGAARLVPWATPAAAGLKLRLEL